MVKSPALPSPDGTAERTETSLKVLKVSMKSIASNERPVAAYRFGAFRLDVIDRRLLRGDDIVALPAKAFETLLLLVRSNGRLVTKEELLAAVWPDAFVSDDSLTQAISGLRRALGDDSSQPVYVATIPRRGYRFVAPVEALAPPEAAVEAERTIETGSPDADASGPVRVSTSRRRWSLLWWALPAAAAVILVARTVSVAPRGTPTGLPIRFLQVAPAGTTLASGGTLSPDGRYLAFLAQDASSGRTHLWLRALDAPVPHVVPGTDGAFQPFWSPDSQSIGFFADGRLKRVGVGGVPPQTLAAVGYRPSGGAWSPRGVIIYADRLSRLFSVPEVGGDSTPVTSLDRSRGEIGHHAPQFLPDGDHFLFYASSSETSNSATYVGSLSSPDRVRLLDATATNAVFAPPGYLLYEREHVLMAQRFDPSALRFTGSAVTVPGANAALEDNEVRVGQVSASANGLLAFGGDRPDNRLTWFSRSGERQDVIPAPANMHNPVLSPDGRFLVAEGGAAQGVWLVDLARGASTRLEASGNLASWSHDGSRVVFTSRSVPDATDILLRPVAGGPDDRTLLVRTGEMKISGNWSPDGRFFTYTASNPQTRLDIWTLTAGSEPQPFLRSNANEMQPQISPDGRWLAYASDESGTWEVYVQSFPTPGQKHAVSVGGGAQPEWRRDGRELYYLSPEGALMVVDTRSGGQLDVGKPRSLFPVPVSADLISYRNQFTVSADGQRFVIDLAAERDPINVVVNWNALVNP